MALELDHVHVDGGRVQSNGLAIDEQERLFPSHGFP
jgi:hypothetical protein